MADRIDRRPTSAALVAWTVATAGLVLFAVARKQAPVAEPAEAAVRLVDGDPDEYERRGLLHVLVATPTGRLEVARDSGHPELAIQVAAAALLLGRRADYDRSRALWPEAGPVVAGVPLEDLALGEAAIAELFLGLAARAGGRPAEAEAALRRAARAAVLAELPLVASVVEEVR
jgi:hypothetical protein